MKPNRVDAMEFFQRQDAFNVFDYLWPNDLLSLSSTCVPLRETVNSYCANLKQVESSPSSSKCYAENYPSACRYYRWWLRHCLHCKAEMGNSIGLDLEEEIGFVPKSLMNYNSVPICSKACAIAWPFLKKITKTEAKSRFSLNEKELSCIRHTEKVNPVFRSAAPMKLFFEAEVELAAMAKFKVASRGALTELLIQRREKQATRTEEIRRTRQMSKDEREKELRTELEKQGLKLRSDSQIAEFYISNSKRAFSLTKSVELIRRAHIVHQHVGDYYRKLLDVAYQDLKRDHFDDHETWSDLWKEEKLSTEEKALRFFAVAKDRSLTKIEKCACGEPLFVSDELKKLEMKLEKEEQKKFEKEMQQRKGRKLQKKLWKGKM